MIERIEITNLALLEKAALNPDAGLTAFSGETGSGKSLMISALDLVTGGRANKDAVRVGAESAAVELVFSAVSELLPLPLQASLIEDGLVFPDEKGAFPDSLTLSREISAAGRSFCRVNGRMISLQRLKEMGVWLLEIQSQRDQAALFDVARQLPLLDRFAGPSLAHRYQLYRGLLEERRGLLRQRRALGGEPERRARELDLLNYQIDEIKRARLRPDEDEKLRRAQSAQKDAARIQDALSRALALLASEGQLAPRQLFSEMQTLLQGVAELHPQWRAAAEQAALLKEQSADLSAELERGLAALDSRPELLERIAQRLDQISDLKRKYGPELSAVQLFLERSEARRAELLLAAETLLSLDETLRQNAGALREAAEQLTEARREAALALKAAVEQELRELGMKDCRFEVDCQLTDGRLGEDGQDQVRFLIASNPGEGLKPLAKIASGGEAARILLAIKVVLTSGHPNATLVFDEVDSGVSGLTCSLIGQKLLRLALENQVFCVTHSAQIAACAAAHVLVSKSVQGERSYTRLACLNERERKDELARLLSGESAKGAAEQVVEGLLERAADYRQRLLEQG